jgi:hypothetical protein
LGVALAGFLAGFFGTRDFLTALARMILAMIRVY